MGERAARRGAARRQGRLPVSVWRSMRRATEADAMQARGRHAVTRALPGGHDLHLDSPWQWRSQLMAFLTQHLLDEPGQ